MTCPTIWYVHPYAGGPDVGRAYRPFEFARCWQAAGARVVVITASSHHVLHEPGRRKGEHSIEGVPYRFLPTLSYASNGIGRLCSMALFAMQVLRCAKKLVQRYGKPDMVIGSSPDPFVFLATHKLARRWQAKSVFEVRDLWPLSIVELLGVSARHPLVWLMERVQRYAYRQADAVVSLLPKTLPYMAQRGLDPARWHYIPNGTNMTETGGAACASPASFKAQQWRAEGRIVLGYPGAFGVPNNMPPLIRALGILRQRGNSRVALIIVGKGEQEQHLKDLIVQCQLQNYVAVFPQVSKKAVLTFLQHVGAGYISAQSKLNLYRYGVSPNKLFDYMRAKLPIVYAIEAGNDPIRECRCGYSVSPGDPEKIADALEALAELSEEERREMGERGYQYGLRHHHYPELASQYLKLLR